MTHKTTITLSFFLLFLVALFGYFLTTGFTKTGILTNEPRNAKVDIKETYHLGWWVYQDHLTVDTFSVSIVQSELSLFNTKSLISYNIKGKLTYKGFWQPYINEIHISERLVPIDTLTGIEAVFIITPVIKVKQDKSKNGGIVYFDITNEHIINSMHWGRNKILFHCDKFSQDLELFQRK